MKRILVVEDDKKIAAALWIRLKAAGYDVVTASDGLKGLSAAVRTKPDLVLLDLWMPGAIGFLVAERLKNLGLAEVPVIFMTASKKEDLWKIAQEIGAAAFFEKPYDPEKLLAAISRILERRASPETATAPAIPLAHSRPKVVNQRKTRDKNTCR
jgi:DNA-binding response OmpR family regulator